MSIADCKVGRIIGIVIATAMFGGALWVVRDTFIDIGWEQYVPYMIGGMVGSIILGITVAMKYREVGWFRALDRFIKKWGVIAGAVPVLVAILITAFS